MLYDAWDKAFSCLIETAQKVRDALHTMDPDVLACLIEEQQEVVEALVHLGHSDDPALKDRVEDAVRHVQELLLDLEQCRITIAHELEMREKSKKRVAAYQATHTLFVDRQL